MPTTDSVDVSETATANTTEGGSRSRNITIKRKRLSQPDVRKSPSKITKKKHTKKAPPRGACVTSHAAPASPAPPKRPAMNVPLRTVRLVKSGHTCYADMYGIDTGAVCWDCAKNGHSCKPVPPGARAAVRAFWDLNRQHSGADDDPDGAWRAAAQRAAQQLRAWGNGAASPAAPAQVPALASFGDVAEKGLEERKVIALETIAEAIAEAVKLWTQLTQRDEEETEEEDEDEENEDN